MKGISGISWSEFIDFRLFGIKNVDVTVGSVLLFLAIVFAAAVVSRLVCRAISRAFEARRVKDEGTIAVTTRLTHYAIMMVGIAAALNTIGVDLTALFAAGAVVAVAVGFAMQTIAQNFVSGVILLAERSITPGDVIEVDGEIVRVTKMSIRTTHARTLDDEEIIMPNSHLVQSAVTNYTLRDTLYRVSCEVGVSYASDMSVVQKTLMDAATGLARRVQDRDPRVFMRAFGDSSVVFSVSVWIDEPWNMATRKSELHFAVWWALKEAGVTIAYPQLDVHFDQGNELARAV